MKGLKVLRVGSMVAGLVISGIAYAQGPPPGPDGPGPGMMDGHRPPIERAFGGRGIEGKWWSNPRIAQQLNLTDDQRKQFDEILLQHRNTLVDLHANLEKAELALEPLVGADQPNENAILSQIDKVAQARAELEKANARYLLAIRSKLTPDQWKQVQDFRKNRDQMRRKWRDDRDGRGPGAPGDIPTAPPPPPGPQGMADQAPFGSAVGAGVSQ
jgi:Spy/CpxP family protein refolding chaperone